MQAAVGLPLDVITSRSEEISKHQMGRRVHNTHGGIPSSGGGQDGYAQGNQGTCVDQAERQQVQLPTEPGAGEEVWKPPWGTAQTV